ncbi:hypothetical protein [Tindallia californiensis]|uniref:N-acetyltransferase domain-containing protein n=1 Tax=Tindallia californiensis TaxID=159292 RepID=A0A1H3NP30_9FIRM|nr:hypothetical protein [Tindallia californiensis]SDY90165.1 hypothetical protein SAMN05192546_105195 [Tindallia californiensis]
MISIKELTPSDYDAFLCYLTCNNVSKDFSIDENSPILILLEDKRIKGFLSTTNYEHTFSTFDYLVTDHDYDFKDGLVRAAINSCYKRGIQWIVCRESFIKNKFPLKDYFEIIQRNHELYSLFSIHPSHKLNETYYFINSDIIYTTGCRGRVSNIVSST